MSKPIRVMLVDDDKTVSSMVAKYLEKEGYPTQVFNNASDCLTAFVNEPVEVIITDLYMGSMSGIELLAEIKKLRPSTEVVVISGAADKRAAIQALHEGAFDFLEKPVDLKHIAAAIKRIKRYQEAVLQCERLGRQVDMITSSVGAKWSISSFVGNSPAAQKVIDQVRNLQKSDKIPVLLQGESGTGKELIAHAIHYGSARSKNPIVPVNCSAVPGDLAESIFFGHIKGSFTGANTDQKGCFEAADGGTLFLDEIGDMPMPIQIKLLRVLEDGQVTPVGSSISMKVDVRIISATNSDLTRKVSNGTFREDLYYRIARFTIEMPPLHARRDDIPLLAEHFVKKISYEMGMSRPRITKGFIDALCKREFKGNVRELRNIIERAMIVCSEPELKYRHLAVCGFAESPQPDVRTDEIPDNLREAEKWLIGRAIQRSGGNISRAARMLGITRAMVYRHNK